MIDACQRLTQILTGLQKAVATRVPAGPPGLLTSGFLVTRIWNLLARIISTMPQAAARAGLPTRQRPPRPCVPREPKPLAHPLDGWRRLRLPRREGWLFRIANIGASDNYLRILLADPDMAALAATPRARRLLRPLCRMLGCTDALPAPAPRDAAPGTFIATPAPAALAAVPRPQPPAPSDPWAQCALPMFDPFRPAIFTEPADRSGRTASQTLHLRNDTAPPAKRCYHPAAPTTKDFPDRMPDALTPAPMAALLAELHTILGPRGMLIGSDTAAYSEDWRRLYQGRTPAVLRPADTAELAAIVRACAVAGTPLVPQGGNTSMVGGAVPSEDGSELVVSLARMNRVRDLDPVDMTVTLEAGITLQAAQQAAEAAGCLLPLSISSEGTAQIGGILATNAGGNNTLRYGNARDLVLGLEVVLPDGQVWNGLRRLRKDNTGYCLRQLFVGAEGTLGIITAAVLKLVPRPVASEVALCAAASPEAALAVFGRFQRHDAAAIQAFEYMNAAGMALVLRHIPGAAMPLAEPAAHYLLVELATPRPGAALREGMEAILEAALESGEIADAVIAESAGQRAALWKLREEHSEAQKREGASVKNDVSVPVSRVPELIARATAACEALMPGIRVVAFGHLGDGNIHFNLEQPVAMDAAAFLARDHEIMDAVGEVVRALDGSFSAEHGVGRLKPYMMPDWRGGAELDLMQRIKRAIDPAGLMNPGKLLPPVAT